MIIRAACPQDRDALRRIYLDAFTADECEAVAALALALLDEEAKPVILNRVAEVEGRVAGHVAFSPVSSHVALAWQGYILAPLAVSPATQRRGVGSALIESGLQLLRERGVNTVLVYGDPDYYGRFGFSAVLAEKYHAPYPLAYPFGWQAIELTACPLAVPEISISCVAALQKPSLW